MDLRDAYRTLEVVAGASEETVRDARKTLSKVWHPDRYTNDPDLQAKAETKLREINEAFEVVRGAGFPNAIPATKPEPAPLARPAAAPPPSAAPAPAAPVPPVTSNIEIVPRRRIRWSVILVLVAAVGVGAYFAILKVGARDQPVVTRPQDSTVVVAPPTPPSPPVDAAAAVVVPRPEQFPSGPTFTFGASQAEVVALQGEPNGTDSSSESESSTVNGHDITTSIARVKLTYGHSEIELENDKVVGWWDNDVRLRVAIAPRDPAVVAAARARGTIAKGQTTDDLLGAFGTPTRVAKREWMYGTMTIELDDAGRIVSLAQ